MGKRGPPKKPSHLKVVQGTDRKDRMAKNEAQPDTAIPDMPDWLPEEAVEFWEYVAPQLSEHRLITELDAPAFTIYACLWASWRKLIEIGDHKGAHRMTSELRAYGNLFGIGPAARSNISLPDKPQDNDDWFAKRATKKQAKSS